jgi:hypothetical protein
MSVQHMQGMNGEIEFFWNDNGAPDFDFKDTVYIKTGNIEKADKNIIIAGIHPEDEYLIYDALGRLLVREKANSDREKVYAGTGAYVVQVNGISYKTVVK